MEDKEVKKRGRPKKEKPIEERIINNEEEKEELEEKLKQVEQTEEKEEAQIREKIKRDLGEEEIEYIELKIPLADKEAYPNKEEARVLEEKVNDVRVEESKKSQTFWGKIFKKNKIKKDGMVAIMALHPQSDATTEYLDTDKDGMFKYGGEDYHVNEHCIYRLKVKKDSIPLMILPTWSLIPIGTKAWFELSQERRAHELQRMILNAIKKEEMIKLEDNKPKGKMNAKLLWIVVLGLIGGYIFLKSRGS